MQSEMVDLEEEKRSVAMVAKICLPAVLDQDTIEVLKKFALIEKEIRNPDEQLRWVAEQMLKPDNHMVPPNTSVYYFLPDKKPMQFLGLGGEIAAIATSMIIGTMIPFYRPVAY